METLIEIGQNIFLALYICGAGLYIVSLCALVVLTPFVAFGEIKELLGKSIHLS